MKKLPNGAWQTGMTYRQNRAYGHGHIMSHLLSIPTILLYPIAVILGTIIGFLI